MTWGELKKIAEEKSIPDDGLVLLAPISGENIAPDITQSQLGYVKRVDGKHGHIYKVVAGAKIPCLLLDT